MGGLVAAEDGTTRMTKRRVYGSATGILAAALALGCPAPEPEACAAFRDEANRALADVVATPRGAEGFARADRLEAAYALVRKMDEMGCELPDWVERQSPGAGSGQPTDPQPSSTR